MPGKIFLFLFLLFSCEIKKNPTKELKIFEARAFLNLATTYQVKIITQEYVNSQNPITAPMFTAQPILEFEAISGDGKTKKVFCLIYRIPSSKGEGGWLKLSVLPCGKRDNSTPLKLAGVKDLLVNISTTGSNSPIFGKKIKPYHLGLTFIRNEKKITLELPLLNLSKEEIFLKGSKKLRESSILNARFSNGIVPTYLPGVTFFPLNGEIKNGTKVEMLGGPSDSYSNGSSKICHQVNEKCETIGEFSCDRCRFGWFETVPTKCNKTGDKFCGIDRCGEKGWPACFRGFKYQSLEIINGCYPNNKSAFCQEGLEVICDLNGVLVCD